MLIDNKKKEFFQRIRFYSNLNKNVDILKDLELITEDNEIKVEVNQDIIESKVREKYIKMLRDNIKKNMIIKMNLLNFIQMIY